MKFFDHNIRFVFVAAIGISISILLVQCRKEKFITDSSAMLEFSRDTIFFDTVFTNIGSTTQYLKVRNRHSESIRISEIVLENGGADSPNCNTPIAGQYRINVDGVNGVLHKDVEILPNDSIHIFVEVTIDPNCEQMPFILEDNIRFVTNGNVQKVNLAAWGQNAHFHGGLNSCGNQISEEITGNVTWTNDLPHVIYGIVAVGENAVLNIQAGTNLYFHSKSGIYVYKGTLSVQGTLDEKVTFQGDRLEAEYANVPGQWGIQLDCPIETGVGPAIASIIRGGIWIYQSPNSVIKHAVIKNGNMGIQVDTTGVPYDGFTYALQIENTQIMNMAGIGLWGQGATIQGKNLLVGNCGQASAYLGIGGKYQMDYCTFGNYWGDNKRSSPAFVLNNYYEDVNDNIHVRNLVNCHFNNCIMYGSNAQLSDFSEFVVDVWPDNEADQQYVFRSCLVDTDQNVNTSNRYDLMISGQAPFLVDPANGDFHISSNHSRMHAQYLSIMQFSDLDGNPRPSSSGLYYKGCYQLP